MIKLSDKWYQFVKWASAIVLPAFIALITGLGVLWEWGSLDKVIGTIALLNAFMGVTLGLSTSAYQGDGAIEIGPDEDGFPTMTNLDLSGITAEEIAGKKQIVLRVSEQPAA